jgi:hypothetical protein
MSGSSSGGGGGSVPLDEIDRRIAELESKQMKTAAKARKIKRKKQQAEPPASAAAKVDMSDVDVCTHLSALKVVYHAVWSGEIEELRNGLLTEAQAYVVMAVTLLLPLLGSGATMLVMFAMVKQLTWRTDALVVIGCNLFRWPLAQMADKETPIWEQFGGDLDIANFLIFLLQAGSLLSWAHVSMSSGGDRWQGEHGLKFAALLGAFALLHNPASAALWKPLLVSSIRSAAGAAAP